MKQFKIAVLPNRKTVKEGIQKGDKVEYGNIGKINLFGTVTCMFQISQENKRKKKSASWAVSSLK